MCYWLLEDAGGGGKGGSGEGGGGGAGGGGGKTPEWSSEVVNARGQRYLKRYLEAVEIMSANGPGSVGYGWDTARATELLSSLQARA